MSAFDSLLDLQAHDTAADQYRHRRANLPERTELATVEKSVATLDTDIARMTGERDTLAREQRRIEDDASAIEAKAAKEDARLYSGTVTAAKELQAIQDEIAALRRRQSTLEDDVLELMVQIEPLDAQLATLGSQREVLGADADRIRERLHDAEAVIDEQLTVVMGERDALAESVPAPTLAEYEALRSRLGGVAVARLEAGSCRGCHLQLSAVELDRIKKLPRDEMVHCEECGRILIR
jgi:hypothetical protein